MKKTLDTMLRPRRGLDQLQRGADGVGGRVHGARHEAVHVAFSQHHGAERDRVLEADLGLQRRQSLVLADRHHRRDIFVANRLGIDDLDVGGRALRREPPRPRGFSSARRAVCSGRCPFPRKSWRLSASAARRLLAARFSGELRARSRPAGDGRPAAASASSGRLADALGERPGVDALGEERNDAIHPVRVTLPMCFERLAKRSP